MHQSTKTRAIIASVLRSASVKAVFWKSISGLPKAFPLLGVLGGELDRALHRGDGADRERQPLLRQLLHQLHKALAFLLAEQVFRRHRDIVEEQLRGVGGVQADLVEVAPAA